MEGLSIRMDQREGRRAEFEDKVEELGKKSHKEKDTMMRKNKCGFQNKQNLMKSPNL